jgi:hypothetical protein
MFVFSENFELRIQVTYFSAKTMFKIKMVINNEDRGIWWLSINLLKPSGNFTYHQA